MSLLNKYNTHDIHKWREREREREMLGFKPDWSVVIINYVCMYVLEYITLAEVKLKMLSFSNCLMQLLE